MASSERNSVRFPPGRWVLLDTNALLLPFQGGFPIEQELARMVPDRKVGVPSCVLGELDRLVARNLEHARAARAFATRFPVIPFPGRGDHALVALARDHGAWIVSSDRPLRARIRAAGGTVLVPTGHGRIEVAGPRIPPRRASLNSPRATVKNRPPLDRRSRRRPNDAAR